MPGKVSGAEPSPQVMTHDEIVSAPGSVAAKASDSKIADPFADAEPAAKPAKGKAAKADAKSKDKPKDKPKSGIVDPF